MYLSFDKYLIGLSVLAGSLAMIIFANKSELIFVGMIGLFSSVMFFLGHSTVKTKYYKMGKTLLMLQLTVLFCLAIRSLGIFAIILGLFALAVTHWTLKLIEKEEEEDDENYY